MPTLRNHIPADRRKVAIMSSRAPVFFEEAKSTYDFEGRIARRYVFLKTAPAGGVCKGKPPGRLGEVEGSGPLEVPVSSRLRRTVRDVRDSLIFDA